MSQGPIPLECLVETIEALTLAKAVLSGTQTPAQSEAWNACMNALVSLRGAIFMANIKVDIKVPPERAPSAEELIAGDFLKVPAMLRSPAGWTSTNASIAPGRPCAACFMTDCNGECMGDGLMGG